MKNSVTIGRSVDNDCIFNDRYVTHHHCRIDRVSPEHYIIQDLDSTNGTFVNGRRVIGSMPIGPYDEVRVANYRVDWIHHFVTDDRTVPIGGQILPPPDWSGSRAQLDDNRSFWTIWLLSILTLGIYGIIAWTRMVNDLNTLASPHDRRHTLHYCLMYFLLSLPTLGIYPLVWNHNMADRIGKELRRRRIDYHFGVDTWWGWGVAGSLLLGIGPIIYLYHLVQSMNRLCRDYNVRG